MALVTASEYKTSRGLTGSGYDTRITAAIGVCEAYIRRYCGRDPDTGFESATWTETISGDGSGTLFLREWPVASITSVKFRESSTVFGTALSTAEYYLSSDTRASRLFRAGGLSSWETTHATGSVWPVGVENIQVIYVGGYATTPDDLAEAVFTLVDTWFEQAGRDTIDAAQSAKGVVNRVARTQPEKWAVVRELLIEWAPPMVSGGAA